MGRPRYRHPIKRHLADVEVQDVPAELREGVRPGRLFSNQCFARAFEYADLHRDKGPLLCHARVRLPGGAPFAHAWVELPGGLAFDGVCQMFLDRDGYLRLMAVECVRRYTPADVARWVRETRHSGPWEELVDTPA